MSSEAEGKKTNPSAIQQCIQCLNNYKEEANGDSSCKFHLSSAWGNRYQCCNRRKNEPGCNTNKHRAQHHTDYKYGEFLNVVSSILNYTNTRNEWASIEAHDLNKNIKLNASIGFITNKAPYWRNHLYIKLNSYWNFKPFSIEYINKFNVNNTYSHSTRILIDECIDTETNGIVYAEWALKQKTNDIFGVYLSIKTETSSNMECVLITFNITNKTLTLNSKEQISSASFVEYKPNKLYHDLIKNHKNGEIIFQGAEFEQNYDAKQTEKDRKNIKRKCFGSMKNDLIISEKRFICNERFSYLGDRFLLEMQFMNKCMDKSFVFVSIAGIYQLFGDENWSNLNENGSELKLRKYNASNSTYLNEIESLPFTINKGRGNTQLIQLEIFLSFEFEKQFKPQTPWFNKSFLGRHKPINFVLKFTDIDGENIVFSTQFITDLYGDNYNKNKKKESVFCLRIQDWNTFKYIKCEVELDKIQKRETDNDNKEDVHGDERWDNFNKLLIRGEGGYVSFDIYDLRSIVFKAIQNKRYIYKFETKNLQKKDGARYEIFGFIDKECHRLYAIKMILTTKSCMKTGFYMLPIYGNISDEIEVKNAMIVTQNEEEKYFENNGLENEFKIDGIVNKYYDIRGDILAQKCREREVDIKEFYDDIDTKEEEGNDIVLLQKKIQQQAKIIDDLQKKLQSNSIINGNDDSVAKWANTLSNKFEEIATLFKAFPGK